MKAVDDKTSQLILNERLGLVLVALGKLSSNMPFIMPKRVAGTPKDTQISEYVGSGPFVFDAANWKPGDKAVFRKNTAYRPRAGKPSWGAGGKVVNVDTVEWISIKDHNPAVNALISGEVDYIESPPVDLLPLLEAADNLKVEVLNKLGNQLMFRLNHLHPPFNNVKARCWRRLTKSAFSRWSSATRGTIKIVRRCSCAAPAWPPISALILS